MTTYRTADRYCGSEGLNEPEGLCGAGYYCALGATSPVPAEEVDPGVGGLCSAGYACVEARDDEFVLFFATLYSSGDVDTRTFFLWLWGEPR